MKIKLLDKDGKIPTRATVGSAGLDLYSACIDDIVIPPQGKVMVPTKIAIQIDSDKVALIFARSGLSTKFGITLTNAVGVIDSDYRGEIKVGLYNNSEEAFTVHHLDRIAQMVEMPIINMEVEVVDNLEDSARGTGGFGSSGVSAK